MRLRSLLAAAAFAASSLAARADTLTFSSDGYSFSLPSAPTSGSSATDSILYQNVSVLYGGTTQLEEIGFQDSSSGSILAIGRNISFWVGGGYGVSYPVLFDNLTTPDIFSGDPSAPTFSTGTYSGISQLDGGDETLAITGNLAAAPEPCSIALLGTGMLGMAGIIRNRYMGA